MLLLVVGLGEREIGLNPVGSIYRPQIETNAYLMVGKPTLRDKF